MRFFRKEVWGYAVLLIILFAIASIAVYETLANLEELDSKVLAVLIWTITLGFMLIAGAFGLWAIQFSAESESRRRIGLLVDTMDYLSDGIVAVNERKQIAGSNPAARRMAASTSDINDQPLHEVFTCLTDEDCDLFVNNKEPMEVERERAGDNTIQTLRFRSQPSEGLRLLLISDVTATNSQRSRARQAAKLQLIGQIAKGVAHDFNSLLCTISGHAALLNRTKSASGEMTTSVSTIMRSAERGIALAAQLLGLTQPGPVGSATYMLAEHVRNAAQILRDSLPFGWEVKCHIQEEVPTVALPGMQIEQVVLYLGLLAADSAPSPGLLNITAGRPGKTLLLDVDARFAGVITLTTSGSAPVNTASEVAARPSSEAGAILSVIRSIIEEAGGLLDELGAADGAPIYRLALPHGSFPAQKKDSSQLVNELKAYVANWAIILAISPHRWSNTFNMSLDEIGIRVERIDNIMSALARIEEARQLDVVILDNRLLGQEARALLKAILRLRPSSGIVVLCEDPESESYDLSSDIIFTDASADSHTMLTAMIESRSLALRRKPSSA